MGNGSSSSRTALSTVNVEAEVMVLMDNILASAGLGGITLDEMISRLEAATGVPLQSKRQLIDEHFQRLLSEESITRKLQPHVRKIVQEAKFSRLTKKDCIKKLETIFGLDIGRHGELIGRLLDEEQTRMLLEEGVPLANTPYVMGEILGKGHYGVVKRAIHRPTGESFAIKIVSMEHLETQYMQLQLRREIDIMKTLVHDNVLRLHEVMETTQFVYLVLELVDGGELFEYAAPPNKVFPEAQARHFFHQLAMGVLYCHRRGVAHRDLKPANLLVTSKGVLKVSDFGLSAFQKTSESGNVHDSMRLKTCCGSPKYIAPEVVADQGGYNGFIADIWSCGVILYLMLAGRAPFEHANVTGLLKKVMSGKYVMPDYFSLGARSLITRMLVLQPDKRATLAEIIAHPWFQVDFDRSKYDQVMQVTAKRGSLPPASNDLPPSMFVPPSPASAARGASPVGHQQHKGLPEGVRQIRSSQSAGRPALLPTCEEFQKLVALAEGKS
eukprot:RCo022534